MAIQKPIQMEFGSPYKRLAEPALAIPALVAMAVGQVVVRYIHIVFGGSTLFYDAEVIWKPLATQVIDGATLYVSAGDNKPPLFQYLNIAVGATGEYVTVFYLLIAAANATAAVLLYIWVSGTFTRKHGLLAAFLFTAALPLVNGTIINVRSFALIGVLAALLVNSPLKMGLALAAAGMFSQYVVFAVPVFLYDAYKRTDSVNRLIRWTWWFGAGCFAVVAVSYGSVGAVWGMEALERAVQSSITRSSYFVMDRPSQNLWRDPTGWASSMARSTTRILFVLVPAGIGLGSYRRLSADFENNRTIWVCSWLSIVFLAAFLVKASSYYWLLPLPFLATMATVVILRNWETRKRSDG